MRAPTTARGPVAYKLIRAQRQRRAGKLVDLSTIAEGQRLARAWSEGDRSEARVDLDPSHAWYSLAQQQLSILIEQTGAVSATRRLAEAITEAEDAYLPSGPPMSPLTGTYFFYWSICDLSPAGDGETLGSATLDLLQEFGALGPLFDAMRVLETSRMGLWVHQGLDGDRVRLRELVTDDEQRCSVPAGYQGEAGEVWLARVVPPPGIEGLDAVVLTTPYVLVGTTPQQWLDCLGRVLSGYPDGQRAQVYPLLMKYGLQPRYWPEYIHEAYAGHQDDAVFLTGFPDIASSRPHAPRDGSSALPERS